MPNAPKSQREASARALEIKSAAAADQKAQRDANAHLAPERVATAADDGYPVDGRGFCDTVGAVEYTKGLYSERSLRKARHNGTGPPYLKIGASVRYSFLALDRWLASRARSCTRNLDAPGEGDDAEAA